MVPGEVRTATTETSYLPATDGLLAVVTVAVDPPDPTNLSLIGSIPVVGASCIVVARGVVWPAAWLARALAWGPVARVGRLSYGLYLWHRPLNPWLLCLDFLLSSSTRTLVCLALTALMAALSYRYVERPFLRLAARLQPAEG